MKKYYSIVFVLGLMLAVSCSKKTSEVDPAKLPVVTVGDNTLYLEELRNVVSDALSPQDSTAAADSYIRAWINDQLVYGKAKQNIVDKAEIERLVEDYRRSLVSNLYQEKLLREYMSKSVSEEELQSFYEQNKERFKLKENLIKGLYLKIPVDSKDLDNFQKWYKQQSVSAVENIEKNSLKTAIGYEYFYDRWVSFDDIVNNMPLAVQNKEDFLKVNKNVEVRDSSFVYLLNIKEYKLVESDAPFDYIKNRLIEVYAEQRKTDYLKRLGQDLYNRAVSDDEIKFYNK